MKKIEAIIRHEKLDAVMNALLSVNVRGMTVTEVRGRGDQHGPPFTYRGTTTEPRFLPRVKVETVVADNQEELVVDTIFQAAHTGTLGDGRILVTRLESVLRIRTGEALDGDSSVSNEESGFRDLPSPRPASRSSSSRNWLGHELLKAPTARPWIIGPRVADVNTFLISGS
jgi:nitrogen regulatory protein P-II 1